MTCHYYLPSRTSLFLGTSSGTLLIWKPKNEFHAEIVRTDLKGHKGAIFDIILVGGGEDTTDTASSSSHKSSSSLPSSFDSPTHLIASSSADRTIKLWDVYSRDSINMKQRCIQTLIGHEGSVLSMTYMRGYLISCSTDHTVRIWMSKTPGGNERSTSTFGSASYTYPYFEVVQEIHARGGIGGVGPSNVPSSIAGVLGHHASAVGNSSNSTNHPHPSSLSSNTHSLLTSSPTTNHTKHSTSVLKSCPCVVGRFLRAETQFLCIGDGQGRVYTFVPPVRSAGVGATGSGVSGNTATSLMSPSGASGQQRTVFPSIHGGGSTIHSVLPSPSSSPTSAAAALHSSSSNNPPSSTTSSSSQPHTFDYLRSHKIHALSVSRMLIVNQESLIITLSYDHTVQVHDCLSSNGYFGIENPTRCKYLAMDWDTRTQELYLSDELGYIQVWNIYIEKCLKSVKVKNEPIYTLSIHPVTQNKLLIGVADGIEVWTIERNQYFNEFKGHEAPIVQLLMVKGESGSGMGGGAGGGGGVNMRAMKEGMKKQLMEGDVDEKGSKLRQSLLTSSDDSDDLSSLHLTNTRYLYTCSLDYTIRQWDSYDMTCLSLIQERDSELSCMLHIEDSIVLVTGHDNGCIKLWNIDSGTFTNYIYHRNTISTLLIARTEKQDCLVSGSFDGTIAVWDITKWSRGGGVGGAGRGVGSGSVNQNTSAIHSNGHATSRGGGGKSRAQHNIPIPEYTLRVSQEEVLCSCYHQPYQLIFTGGNDTLIHMWSFSTRTLQGVFKGHENAVSCLVIDGDFLISGSDDTTIRIWSISHHYEICCLRGRHELAVRDLCIIPNYGYIISAAFDGRVIIWDYKEAVESGSATIAVSQPLKEYHHSDKRFRCLLYDAEQRKIFAGTEEARIMFFLVPKELLMGKGGDGVMSKNASTASLMQSKDHMNKRLHPSTTINGGRSSSPTPTLPSFSRSISSSTITPSLAASSLEPSPAMSKIPSQVKLENLPLPTEYNAGTSIPPPFALAAALEVDYSLILADLLLQSTQLDTLLSTVKPLTSSSRPSATTTSSSSSTPGDSSSATKNQIIVNASVSSTNTRKHGAAFTSPSDARRASMKKEKHSSSSPSEDVSKSYSQTELSPPTKSQTLAMRASLTSSGKWKDGQLRGSWNALVMGGATGGGGREGGLGIGGGTRDMMSKMSAGGKHDNNDGDDATDEKQQTASPLSNKKNLVVPTLSSIRASMTISDNNTDSHSSGLLSSRRKSMSVNED